METVNQGPKKNRWHIQKEEGEFNDGTIYKSVCRRTKEAKKGLAKAGKGKEKAWFS